MTPNVYGEWRIVGTGLSGRPTLPCLSPPSNAERSAETPDFVEHTFLSDQEGSVQDEYWVDALGRPTRSRQTLLPTRCRPKWWRGYALYPQRHRSHVLRVR